ncbi:hypothetical protein ANN_09309 [Periplaneta americana]|uniref:Uncharacterized protein n=1 Tax=Periplaneta americana TaxID=6978 RepID=A0ABQ8TNH5_PERAM|nr:hypothetical protein ANN_09309 [Periplaneta americana]
MTGLCEGGNETPGSLKASILPRTRVTECAPVRVLMREELSQEISASVWDRCPPSIVMHLGSYDSCTPLRRVTLYIMCICGELCRVLGYGTIGASKIIFWRYEFNDSTRGYLIFFRHHHHLLLLLPDIFRTIQYKIGKKKSDQTIPAQTALNERARSFGAGELFLPLAETERKISQNDIDLL